MTPDTPYPTRTSIDGLSSSTSIQWTKEGLAAIEAERPLDALTALGFVHGQERGWTVALWRQTALGTLSRWFGTGVVPLDRHIRRLGIARRAQEAFEQMPEATQNRLQAYCRGLNAALLSSRVQQQDPFLLLDVQPEPWKPWHTLAVERLLAWLATPPLDIPSGAPSAVADFQQINVQLRRWLHLHGWERSMVWAARKQASPDSSRTVLFQRHVLGASATPIVQEVTLRHPGIPRLSGATLPGVPFFITGTFNRQAWASLLRSPSEVARLPLDSIGLTQHYERLNPSNGDERLVRIQRLNRSLLLASDTSTAPRPDTAEGPTSPDTTRSGPSATAWVLRWPGFSTKSDLSAWLQRANLSHPTDTASFHLFEADGLRLSTDSSWTITGTPAVIVRDTAKKRIVIGQSNWTRHQARSLRHFHQTGGPLHVGRWSASDSSTWAARLLPTFQPALDRLTRTHPQFTNVATYLQNWDHTYEPSSIGATLFDQWMRAYRNELGHVPTLADTSVYFGTYRQHRALLHALDSLQTRFGPDVRQWRWERAVSDRRYFPVWSADSLVSANLRTLSTSQYAPLDRSGRGHPSTLMGGPSLVDPSPTAPSPTTWDGWMMPADSTLVVRRHHYDPTAIFARSRIRRTRPSPVRLSPDSVVHTTTLVPTPE